MAKPPLSCSGGVNVHPSGTGVQMTHDDGKSELNGAGFRAYGAQQNSILE
jgi:hypothetical protein